MANDRRTAIPVQRTELLGRALRRYRVLVQSALFAASAAGLATLGIAVVL
jgi:hypothetical protein